MDYELSNVYYEKKVKALEKLAVEKGCDKKSIENVRTMIGVSRELLEDILKFIDIQGAWILSIPVIRMKYPFMEKIRQKRNVWKWKRLSKRYRK